MMITRRKKRSKGYNCATSSLDFHCLYIIFIQNIGSVICEWTLNGYKLLEYIKIKVLNLFKNAILF